MKKRVKKEKAQVSLFIIIAIIIVGIIIIFFIFRENIFQKDKINPEIKPVYDYVKTCIENTGEDAIYQIG